MQLFNIGIIGTDTSHSVAFTRLLNDPNHVDHVTGGRVVAAFPGGSHDFALSADRVEGFMVRLEEEFGVQRMDSPEEVAASCDAILLTSADGRVHLEQFKRIAPYGKPVFIDKPLVLSPEEALEIFRVAKQHKVAIMSSSALRYAEQITEDIERVNVSAIRSAAISGPLAVEPTQSYYYWYGIHSVELLYTVMGVGCLEVNVTTEENHDFISAKWMDGRTGTIKLSRSADSPFCAAIHREDQSTSMIEINANAKPFYASMLEQIMILFHTHKSPLDWRETLEIICFIEAAEESKQLGKAVQL